MGVRSTIVRYRVKPGLEEPNAELVRAVYRELAELGPDGFSYATFRIEDGRTFVHIAVTDAERASAPLPGLEAFRRFQAEIAERCEWGPEVSEAEQVGSFGTSTSPAP